MAAAAAAPRRGKLMLASCRLMYQSYRVVYMPRSSACFCKYRGTRDLRRWLPPFMILAYYQQNEPYIGARVCGDHVLKQQPFRNYTYMVHKKNFRPVFRTT